MFKEGDRVKYKSNSNDFPFEDNFPLIIEKVVKCYHPERYEYIITTNSKGFRVQFAEEHIRLDESYYRKMKIQRLCSM